MLPFNMAPYIAQQLFRILLCSTLIDGKTDTLWTAACRTANGLRVYPQNYLFFSVFIFRLEFSTFNFTGVASFC